MRYINIYDQPVLHTENVARGANWVFPKCKGVYNVLTFQKSRGAKSSHLGGECPRPPKWNLASPRDDHGRWRHDGCTPGHSRNSPVSTAGMCPTDRPPTRTPDTATGSPLPLVSRESVAALVSAPHARCWSPGGIGVELREVRLRMRYPREV